MKYSRRQATTGNKITDLHMRSFETVAHLYDGQNPGHLDTYRQRADGLDARFSLQHRHQLAEALISYGKATGASEASLKQADRLRDPRSVAVVTGQQSGLFLGPLFSIYKALSAIGLASRLEEDLKRPVIPIFWIASEDHDFGEVDHAYVLDAEDEIQRIRLPLEPHTYQMVYHQGLTSEAVDEVVAKANALLPDTAFKGQCINDIRACWKPGMSLAAWFACLLHRVLGNYGLVMFDPCLPALRQLARPVWTDTLDNILEIRSNLDAAYDAVQSMEVAPAVVRDRMNSTLFFVQDGKRYVLEADDDGTQLTARHLGVTRPVSQWRELAEEDPSAFSSNVLLRPVVQDRVIPTLCYIGGPAEIAYYPLSAGVFHGHGLNLPPLALRQRVTLIPPTVERSMEQYRVSEDILLRPLNLVEDAISRHGGKEIRDYVARLQRESDVRWEEFAKAFTHFGPQIFRIAEHQAQKEKDGIRRVEAKTLQLLEEKQGNEVRKLRSIERWLWTDGHLQERRLSLLSFWARYGIDWIANLPQWADYQCQGVVYHVQL